jgi:hypothetical protein
MTASTFSAPRLLCGRRGRARESEMLGTVPVAGGRVPRPDGLAAVRSAALGMDAAESGQTRKFLFGLSTSEIGSHGAGSTVVTVLVGRPGHGIRVIAAGPGRVAPGRRASLSPGPGPDAHNHGRGPPATHLSVLVSSERRGDDLMVKSRGARRHCSESTGLDTLQPLPAARGQTVTSLGPGPGPPRQVSAHAR